jgi:hypothetical protein
MSSTLTHNRATNSMNQKIKVFITCYWTTVLMTVFTKTVTWLYPELLYCGQHHLDSLISISFHIHACICQAVSCSEVVEQNSAWVSCLCYACMRGTCHSHLILFSAPPVTSTPSLSCPNILFSTLFTNNQSLYMWDKISCPGKTRGKILICVF